MKVKRRNFPSPSSIKCSSSRVVVISIQVGDCWLWSPIFQIQRYYSVVFVPWVYCKLIPPALGCVLANSSTDPWYWVNRSNFPWYFPYKIKNCNTTVYGIILYCKQYLWLCGRDYESMKRKCSGFSVGCIPSSFCTIIKGLTISLWT